MSNFEYDEAGLRGAGEPVPSLGEEVADGLWWCWERLHLVLFFGGLAAAAYASASSLVYAAAVFSVACVVALVVWALRS